MGKRIKLGLIFTYNENWIGGTYYILNLISALNKLPDNKQPLIYILSNTIKDLHRAKELGYKYLKYFNPNVFDQNYFDKLVDRFLYLIFRKNIYQKLILYSKINVLFPANNNPCYDLIKNKIYWFPDFQHLYYPEYFSEIDLLKRNSIIYKIASSKKKLVLSSFASMFDWDSINLTKNCNVFVLPFAVSHPYLVVDNTINLLVKYSISQPYFIVSNQFWKHKNHIVVLKAILECKNSGFNTQVVFTGKFDCNDNDNAFSINAINDFIQKHSLQENIKILGLIDRCDQLLLLKSSIAVIQPSLFEGWSTVIEDAKAQKKLVVASDIPVHREQIHENVLFFNPSSEFDLAKSLKLSTIMEYQDGNLDYYSKIIEFGTKFLDIIRK
jgi:hypothetical protein